MIDQEALKKRYHDGAIRYKEIRTGYYHGLYKCDKCGTLYYQYVHNHKKGINGCPLCKRNRGKEGGLADIHRYPDALEIRRRYSNNRAIGYDGRYHCNKHNIDYWQCTTSYKNGYVGCPECKVEKISQWSKQVNNEGQRSRSEWEVDYYIRSLGYETKHLEQRFGSIRRECDIVVGDKGIEIDGMGHLELYDRDAYYSTNPRPKAHYIGYHKEKDDLFKSMGITVLHITDSRWKINPEGCKRDIKMFLEGTYKGPLIDISDKHTYGNIDYKED